MPRNKILGKPGITWTVLGDSSREGLDYIIDSLKGRYNDIMTNEHFRLDVPSPTPELRRREKVRLNVFKEDDAGMYKPYGYVSITYGNTTTDRTTSENKLAQLFWVYFNMVDKSDQETNYFLKQK